VQRYAKAPKSLKGELEKKLGQVATCPFQKLIILMGTSVTLAPAIGREKAIQLNNIKSL